MLTNYYQCSFLSKRNAKTPYMWRDYWKRPVVVYSTSVLEICKNS